MMMRVLIVAVVVAYVIAMPIEEPIGKGVPHPNSDAGVPHPNSDAGRALSGKNDEKHVLEGGTQVKPWLKEQPNLANLREHRHQ
ncbi:unnamed protein product [Caenorhabditis auriculariae]|uniref:Secreted protein n=1 Tax=Caenorhabditis auriculariae TaxID=2777116 RepID=A0A8S1GR83_9PELO|nr:unnamed protein product [Caenorhabditis auriculariae]